MKDATRREGGKKRILIVDDDLELLDELHAMLSDNGYEAETCPDGIFVWNKIRESRPDVILLDLKMDGKSGFQVADDLKGLPETAAIPVIAMTGYFSGRDQAQLMERCGISWLIRKPLNPPVVMAAIEAALDAGGRT